MQKLGLKQYALHGSLRDASLSSNGAHAEGLVELKRDLVELKRDLRQVVILEHDCNGVVRYIKLSLGRNNGNEEYYVEYSFNNITSMVILLG